MNKTSKAVAVAKILGCTPDQITAQLAKNARQLRQMEAEAKAKGRKVNGYTASDLGALAQSFEQRSMAKQWGSINEGDRCIYCNADAYECEHYEEANQPE